MSKTVLPWSLKGISPEAREIAKKAAAQHDMTIGEWVSAAIRDIGPAEIAVPGSPGEGSLQPDEPAALEESLDVERLRRAIRERIYASEEQIAHIVGPLQDIIEQMSRRLTRLEEARLETTALESQTEEQGALLEEGPAEASEEEPHSTGALPSGRSLDDW